MVTVMAVSLYTKGRDPWVTVGAVRHTVAVATNFATIIYAKCEPSPPSTTPPGTIHGGGVVRGLEPVTQRNYSDRGLITIFQLKTDDSGNTPVRVFARCSRL